jgi:chromosome segregation ATPase
VNLTNRILTEIRDEVRDVRNEVRDVRRGVAATNERLDAMRIELSERITESELRTATALIELAGTVRDLTSLLRAQADLRPRVERCEHDIAELRARLG